MRAARSEQGQPPLAKPVAGVDNSLQLVTLTFSTPLQVDKQTCQGWTSVISHGTTTYRDLNPDPYAVWEVLNGTPLSMGIGRAGSSPIVSGPARIAYDPALAVYQIKDQFGRLVPAFDVTVPF